MYLKKGGNRDYLKVTVFFFITIKDMSRLFFVPNVDLLFCIKKNITRTEVFETMTYFVVMFAKKLNLCI